jgi:ATP-dependent DNA helicase RecG
MTGALPTVPPFDDELVGRVLELEESQLLEMKRAGKNDRKIEAIVAFANTEGGTLVIGIEDQSKASGRDRVYGIQENPESVDELRRLLRMRVTPPLAPPDVAEPRFLEIGCLLRDGSRGSVMFVQVEKSAAVHSVVDDGTFVRLLRSNRQLAAGEIADLALRRGSVSYVSALVDVPFELLDTSTWRDYAAQRRLTRPIGDAMSHLGLARDERGRGLLPTRAAVLLFAEDPSGLLDTKCAIRLFHYRGEKIEHVADTNLVRPPRTIGGPLITQIRDASRATLDDLASGVQVGPLGFEIAQRYPVRVIVEAITNAVIHRDYHVPADIQIRVFANRIEVESPGALPGAVTLSNLQRIGSRPRNRALADHLREFPAPPNLDAGEGVRMMFQTMSRARLYPPLYLTPPAIDREAVLVVLLNEARPSIWDQVSAYLDKHGTIGNVEIRKILRTDDTVGVSRLLKSWVENGLLSIVDPAGGKKQRRYRRPDAPPEPTLFSPPPGNEAPRGPQV